MANKRKIILAVQAKGYRLNVFDRSNGQWEIGIKAGKAGDQPTQLMHGKTLQEVLQIIEQLPEGEPA